MLVTHDTDLSTGKHDVGSLSRNSKHISVRHTHSHRPSASRSDSRTSVRDGDISPVDEKNRT